MDYLKRRYEVFETKANDFSLSQIYCSKWKGIHQIY